MTHTSKSKYLFSKIVQLAKSDGNIDIAETSVLRDVGLQLGLSENEIAILIESDIEFNKPLAPLSQSEITTQIMNMFRVAIADGKLNDVESNMLRQFTITCGMDPELTDELIHLAKKEIEVI